MRQIYVFILVEVLVKLFCFCKDIFALISNTTVFLFYMFYSELIHSRLKEPMSSIPSLYTRG